MRVLITGARGFVAPYAAQAFRSRIAGVALVAASREGGAVEGFDEAVALDLENPAAMRAAVAAAAPTHVLHLAGVAAPQEASADPDAAWRINALGALALGRALLAVAPDATLLNAGSGAAYGDSANRIGALDEDAAFAPGDEYGATKAAADLGLGALAKRGLRVVRLRPFNHTGPGQSESYAIPAFAAQIAAIERGAREPVVKVGNLDAERDFCDVADVARAYVAAALAAAQGRIAPGRAYNLCSGRALRMGGALDLLLSMSSKRIAVVRDPARMRPSDIPRIVGDPSRAQAELGWRATTPFEETARATLESFRRA